MKSKKTEYHLEVYEADASHTVAFSFKSDTPFTAIAVGDLIGWQQMNLSERLQATKVEHLFWEGDTHQAQKVCVYTKLIRL